MTAPQEPLDPFRPPAPRSTSGPPRTGDPAPLPAPDAAFGAALPPPSQPYGSAAPPRSGPSGTLVVVLGALALLLCWTLVGVLLGGAALVLGLRARRRGGAGRATAGAVLGGLGLVAGLGLVVAAVVLLTSDTGERLRECLEQAQGDGQARQQCEQELRDSLTG